MAVPPPEPGLVINYAYLWHYEHQAGQEEGGKDRPTVIVLCIEGGKKGETIVTVLPITHRKPTRMRQSRSRSRSNVISVSMMGALGLLLRKGTSSSGRATISGAGQVADLNSGSCRPDSSTVSGMPSLRCIEPGGLARRPAIKPEHIKQRSRRKARARRRACP
jgi:hypothetical protein